MTHIEHIGKDLETQRELYVLDIPHSNAIPATISKVGKYATILIAWDAFGVSPEVISRLARQLIEAGVAYFCAWGNDCERVHDIIDEEWLMNGEPTANAIALTTTWHDSDSLADTLWFALYNATPTADYVDQSCPVIAICIGSPDWATEVRSVFANPER